MMAWTDRHCRVFHRMISREVLLYTEMVTAPALVLGGALRLLDFSPEEQPVALQLGGSDPAQLAKATALGAAFTQWKEPLSYVAAAILLVFGKIKPIFSRGLTANQGTVRVQHAFRVTGGTRGINQVGRVIGGRGMVAFAMADGGQLLA